MVWFDVGVVWFDVGVVRWDIGGGHVMWVEFISSCIICQFNLSGKSFREG